MWLPPRAFQYLSAIGLKRLSSSDRLCRVASIACFSEQTRPICTSSALLQGKDLGPEHGRVGDADELIALCVGVVPGDDEEPRAVRRAVNVRRLDRPVNFLLFRRQTVKIHFAGRRQRLDDVLKGISINPVPQVK